ncbi:hypothetical protein BGX26_006933 [Mortierella sp. AD094]|nr:hypothetical protein BGX26_006933 [Mortierella sp. AD094]
MDVETNTAGSKDPSAQKMQSTLLTRLCDAQSEHFYIYLTVEMEPPQQGSEGASTKWKPTSMYQLSILTFRKMLSSAVQDLFGAAMGGGINIDILGFWTDQFKDPYNRMAPTTASSVTTSIPTQSTSGDKPTESNTATTLPLPSVSVKPTYSPTTAASAILKCHSLDFNQLWNALTLFNTLVDDYESRFEVRYISSTLLGLQANSRQLNWPNQSIVA